MKIHQYIIGTGGADLDSYTNPSTINRSGKIKNTDIQYQYNVVKTLDNVVYGYMNCSISKDGLNCSFKQISNKTHSRRKSYSRRKSHGSLRKTKSW